MFKFLTKRHLIWNILVGLLISSGLIFGVFYGLNSYTKHGKTSKVPSVVGKTFAEAQEILKQNNFKVEIQDSVFIDSLPPGVTIKQIPEADEIVKLNRTVYLVVNTTTPPLIEVPNVYGYAKELAIDLLTSRGFKIGDTIFRNDFTPNSILEIKINNVKLEKGSKAAQGSKIDLVISSGPGTSKFDVPDLFALRFKDAKTLLESLMLQPSAVMVMPGETIKDTASAYVYKQSPARYDPYSRTTSKIVAGSGIDIWLSNNPPPESARVDTINMSNLPIADPNAIYKPDPEMQGAEVSDPNKPIKKKPKPKPKKVTQPPAPQTPLPPNSKTDK